MASLRSVRSYVLPFIFVWHLTCYIFKFKFQFVLLVELSVKLHFVSLLVTEIFFQPNDIFGLQVSSPSVCLFFFFFCYFFQKNYVFNIVMDYFLVPFTF